MVTVAFLAGFALAVEGCDEESYEHCVDENGNVVDPALCIKADDGPYVHRETGGHVYRYWYGGHTAVGSHVSGGSFEGSHVSVTGVHGTTTRGGFGSTGAGHVGSGA
jgi:hypothetical protein